MIRPAIHADIPGLLSLGRAMHAESRYASAPWNETKVDSLITALVDGDDGLALVAVEGDAVIGGFLAACFDHYFSDARTAGDYALFVPPGRRGGLLGAQLVRGYIGWARSRGVADEFIQLGTTTGVAIEQTAGLYQALGFTVVGHNFALRSY